MLQTKLMLYGRVSSGKTSLLHAFIYACANGKLKHSYNKCNLNVAQKNGVERFDPIIASDYHFDNVSITDPDAGKDYIFQFQRQIKPSQSGVVISQHVVHIRDESGELFLANYDGKKSRWSIEKEGTPRAERHLIVTVNLDDPTDENAKLLQSLINNIYHNDRYVSIVITKYDQLKYQIRNQSVQDILDTYVTPNISENLKQHFGQDNIQFYKISSAGFIQSDFDKPNFNPNTEKLVDSENWIPWLVEEPFFHILQNIELEELGEDEKINYVPYYDV